MDLGFAPGSWTQVAHAKTRPGGRILGIDLLPAPPPIPGVIVVQGDFLDHNIRKRVIHLLSFYCSSSQSCGIQNPSLSNHVGEEEEEAVPICHTDCNDERQGNLNSKVLGKNTTDSLKDGEGKMKIVDVSSFFRYLSFRSVLI